MRTPWQVHGVIGEDNIRRFVSWHIWHKIMFVCLHACLCVWFQVLADAVSRLVVDKFSELTDNFTSPHARRKVLAGVVMTTGRFGVLLCWQQHTELNYSQFSSITQRQFRFQGSLRETIETIFSVKLMFPQKWRAYFAAYATTCMSWIPTALFSALLPVVECNSIHVLKCCI